MIRGRLKKSLVALLSVFVVLLLASGAMATDAYLPHLTGGEDDWNDVLEVDNFSSTNTYSYSLLLYNQGVEAYRMTYSIPPMGYAKHEIKNLVATATCGKIQYDSDDLNFRIAYQNKNGGGVAQFRSTSNVANSIGITFANFADFIGWKGLAIQNTGTSPVTVKLYALGEAGLLGTAETSIGAHSRVSNVYSGFFPGIALADLQKIVAQTDNPVLSGISISGSNDQSKLLFTTAGQHAFTPPTTTGLSMTCGAFSEGEKVPVKYTCDGDDVSPAFSWSGVPSTAESLALLCYDPDAPSGNFIHWIAYDLPTASTGLAENVAKAGTISGGGYQGVNSFGGTGYGGPCPPAGASHKYVFVLYAVDTALGIGAGASYAEFVSAIDGHILEQVEVNGYYE